ncbi:Inorganic pyrophosphatase [Spraguea lophii 42_110]|uniref:inorganic diphosphatase n=1 Tax=Spraguea lophii (strain 42_110) TaxID=1358809 RepID=S7XLG1_SPRLO|nr:Inorganic pyrophosphatase [Spraguea lophii 42_110]
MLKYSKIRVGKKHTEEFCVYITKDEKIISPFHDVELYPENNQYISVINEIPRFENGKFEINVKRDYNPIVQDKKNGELRYVDNIFPFKGYPWNYGAIPQTWENPEKIDEHTGLKGDNDPLDAIDISSVYKGIGDVYQAKILGVLGLIDDGECDYKILVIDKNDPKISLINNLEDVETYFPGLLEHTCDWFKYYKIPDNKPQNLLCFNERFQNKELAKQIITECHKSWKSLMENDNVGKKVNKTRGPMILDGQDNGEDESNIYTGYYHRF